MGIKNKLKSLVKCAVIAGGIASAGYAGADLYQRDELLRNRVRITEKFIEGMPLYADKVDNNFGYLNDKMEDNVERIKRQDGKWAVNNERLILMESNKERNEELINDLFKRLGVDGRYDMNDNLVIMGTPEKLFSSNYLLFTKTTVNNTMSNKPLRNRVYNSRGVCTVLPGGYVLTVKHVCDNSDKVKKGEFWKDEFSVQSKDGKLIPVSPIVESVAEDVAIFKLPAEVGLTGLEARVGSSEELVMGNWVYLIGNPFLTGNNVREGIVEKNSGYGKNSAFWISNGVNFGDSGSPVYALRDGVPELVGLVHAKMVGSSAERLGLVVCIDKAKKLVEEYGKRDGFKKQHKPLFDYFGLK